MSQELPKALYKTPLGAFHVGDSRELLKALPNESVDLIMTSPPFALQRQKAYGNESQENYIDWLMEFVPDIKRVLKETGSFVLDLGGSYEKGKPVRSLYNFRVAIRICDEFGLKLAEDFYWFNPSKLPSPIEWVNKRKIRAKDSVNRIVLQEGKKAGLKPPYHVYARYEVYQSKNVYFYKIPDKILAHLGLNES
jgi:SAM-dependent methyltransferase